MSTELTTEASLLKQAISEVGGRTFITIPQIGMVNNMSKIEGMEKGEYYIRRTEEKDGKRETVYESIGFDPEVTIFLRRYTYSKFLNSEDKMVAWTNEIEGFDVEDTVHLVNNRGEKPELECSLPYPQFKEYITENYKNEDGQQTMKFKNVLYIKYKENFYRMFVSNASVTGIPTGESHGDYKNPQEGSFTAWENTVKSVGDRAYFHGTVRLGNVAVEGEDYYLMTFTDVGLYSDEDRKTFLHEWVKLKRDLGMIQASQFKNFVTPDAEVSPPPAPQLSEADVDNLPF